MINTRHPFITYDLLMSVLKLAVVTREPVEYSRPLAVESEACMTVKNRWATLLPVPLISALTLTTY